MTESRGIGVKTRRNAGTVILLGMALVTLRREGDALYARAEGIEEGKARSEEWVWTLMP